MEIEIEMKALSIMSVVAALLLCSCSDNDAAAPSASGNSSVTNATGGSPAGGASDTPEQIVTRLFQSADLNHNGMLTVPEAAAFLNLTMISQDTDEDGQLNLAEFQAWDAGFSSVADARGSSSKYAAAKAALFKRWDANGDGYLTSQEREAAIRKDFGSVRTAEERHMSPAEFTNVPFIRTLAAAAA